MAEYIVDIASKITVNCGAMSLDMTDKIIQGMRVSEEIIRCRDCGSCNSECKCTNPRFCYDNGAIMHCPKVDPNGFCAWAERSE